MLKLLRNLVLAGILLAGALKLLAWYAVGQDADRLVTAAVPYAQIKYDGLSAGLDGSVTLSGVTLSHVATHRVYRADSVTLETPGLFWLLKHALLQENTLPAQFAVATNGMRLPPEPWLSAQWIDPATFVPFATLGCGVDAFSAADYAKMGFSERPSSDRFEYRFDEDAHSLNVALTLTAPGSASLTIKGDVRPFDPGVAPAWEKLHVDQMTADYTDEGFLRQRNQFCARRNNIGPEQFIDNHVAAVQVLLKQHRVEASNELAQLYRNLLTNGGQVSVLSLPGSNFRLGSLRSAQPEDLLRQLNVTARYRDTPPIMFRLTFAPPPEGDTPPTSDTPPAATPSPGPAPPAVSVATTTPTPEKPLTTAPTPAVASNTAPPLAVSSPQPAVAPAASSPPPLPAPVKPNSPAQPAPVQASPAPVAATAKPDPAKHGGDNLGLHDLDRAEAKLAPPPPVVPYTQRQGSDTNSVVASSPPPPPGSTLALVWKPGIDPMPPSPPERRDYDVIEYAGLKNLPGRRVRLITDGGKRVEGYVISADEGSVMLRIRHGDGDAEFEVPKNRIQQVQLLHIPGTF